MENELPVSEKALAEAIMMVVNTTPLGWVSCNQLRLPRESSYTLVTALLFTDTEAASELLGGRIAEPTYVESGGLPARPTEGRYSFGDGAFPQAEDERPRFGHWTAGQCATWQRLTEVVSAVRFDEPRRNAYFFDLRLSRDSGQDDVRAVILAADPEQAELVAMRLLDPCRLEGVFKFGGVRYASAVDAYLRRRTADREMARAQSGSRGEN